MRGHSPVACGVTAWPGYALRKPEPYLCEQRVGGRAGLPEAARFPPRPVATLRGAATTLLPRSPESTLTGA